MMASRAKMKVGPITIPRGTPSRTRVVATTARTIRKPAATSGGRALRLLQARSIAAAASRQARSSAASPRYSLFTSAGRRRGAGRGSPSESESSGGCDRLGAEPRLGPHVDLVELLLGKPAGPDQLTEIGADDRKREPDRDADDADVLQREGRMRVHRHGPARADGDQPDGDGGATDQRGHRPPRVEPFPEEREQYRRQVRRRRDDERNARDEGRGVGSGADASRQPDRQESDEAGRDSRDEHLLLVADVAMEDVGADDVDVEIVAERT